MPLSGNCSANALCQVSANGRTLLGCNCKDGFIGNGFICQGGLTNPRHSRINSNKNDIYFLDIDECSTGQHDCHVHAMCTNIPGKYECNCRGGYFGNGTLCIGKFSVDNNSTPKHCP